jgi:D-proline reductase (dithiol) PrdB
MTQDRLPPPTDDPGPPDTPGPFRTGLLNRIWTILRDERDPAFDFVQARPIPWMPLAKPPTQSTVALVSTGGLHRRGDKPFDVLTSRWGDTGYRVLAHGTPRAELDLEADYVDDKYIRPDPEVTLPMAALDALVRAGRVGRAAARHYSFCEGIMRPLPGIADSAAAVAALMREDGVDAVVLLPTCSLCVQTIALLSSELERHGLPTVTVSLLPELTEHVGAPRPLHVRFPFGAPCGDPHNRGLHQAVLAAALDWLQEATVPGQARHCPLKWRGEYPELAAG